MRALSHWRLSEGWRWHFSWNSVRVRAHWGLTLLALAVIVCTASPVLAQVPRVYGQGAAASGMGNAFAAQADNPSALHYNPAGMTQLGGVQMMAGGTSLAERPTLQVGAELRQRVTMVAPSRGLLPVMPISRRISKALVALYLTS